MSWDSSVKNLDLFEGSKTCTGLSLPFKSCTRHLVYLGVSHFIITIVNVIMIKKDKQSGTQRSWSDISRITVCNDRGQIQTWEIGGDCSFSLHRYKLLQNLVSLRGAATLFIQVSHFLSLIYLAYPYHIIQLNYIKIFTC
jgi:hypothetical protein